MGNPLPSLVIASAAACLFPAASCAQPDRPAAVLPATSSNPTAPGPNAAIQLVGPRIPLLSEGARLVARPARMISAPTGEWIFVFEQADPELPPMVAVPSTTLQRILLTRGEEDAIVAVTGDVLSYEKHNYLVPTGFRLLSGSAAAAPDEDQPARETTLTPGDDPIVKRLLAELDAARRAGGPSLAASPVEEDASKPAVSLPTAVGEGTVILRRRGRLSRLNDGSIIFSPDTDEANPKAATPMRLVPSTVLEDIERTARRLGPEFPLVLTGRTLTYSGEVYLVPTSFKIERRTQVRPLQ